MLKSQNQKLKDRIHQLTLVVDQQLRLNNKPGLLGDLEDRKKIFDEQDEVRDLREMVGRLQLEVSDHRKKVSRPS